MIDGIAGEKRAGYDPAEKKKNQVGLVGQTVLEILEIIEVLVDL